jgi:hypothetical protein
LRVVEVEYSCGFALRLLFIDDVAPSSSALDVSFAVSLLAWRYSSYHFILFFLVLSLCNF